MVLQISYMRDRIGQGIYSVNSQFWVHEAPQRLQEPLLMQYIALPVAPTEYK